MNGESRAVQVGRLGGAMITFEANALEVGKGNFAARHEVAARGWDW